MKKRRSKIMRLFLGLVLLCLFGLLAERVYTEVRYQLWLRQDERRVNFKAYDDPEALRDKLLTLIPLGSSEQDARSFIIANGDPRDLPPSGGEGGYGPFGVGMFASRAPRGFLAFMMLFASYPGWGITFELDPEDHRVIEIHVRLQPGL